MFQRGLPRASAPSTSSGQALGCILSLLRGRVSGGAFGDVVVIQVRSLLRDKSRSSWLKSC